jgi:phosphatidylethanolamine-binding protein (PEBP) family uncharacterized protein
VKILACVLGCLIALATVPALAASPMGVMLSFTSQNKCQGQSPEILLSGVPAGTVAYHVQMIDEDVPSFRHWNQTINGAGPAIPAGAGRGEYYGPCPPSGRHTYRVTVTALDAAGKPLAQGEYSTQADRN